MSPCHRPASRRRPQTARGRGGDVCKLSIQLAIARDRKKGGVAGKEGGRGEGRKRGGGGGGRMRGRRRGRGGGGE